MFLNQSFWQAAVMAKPGHTVFGFLSGAVAFFSIPMMLSFIFGMAYLSESAYGGSPTTGIDAVVTGKYNIITITIMQ